MSDVIANAGDDLATLLDPLLNPQPKPGVISATSPPNSSVDSQANQSATTSSASPAVNSEPTTATTSNSVTNAMTATVIMSTISPTPSSTSMPRGGASPSSEPPLSHSSTLNSNLTPNGSSTPSSNSISVSDSPALSGSSMPSSTSTPNDISSAAQTKAVVGGVTGVTAIIVLGLIVLWILRRQRRHKATRLASSREASSSNVLYQRMPRSTRFSTTPRPFLESPMIEISSSSKGTIYRCGRELSTQNNQRNVEQAIDSSRDILSVQGNLSNKSNKGQEFRDTIDLLQALTSQFEREVQRLSVMRQSEQLSTEDRLRMEETTRNRMFMPSNISPSSSPPPPPYRTRGG